MRNKCPGQWPHLVKDSRSSEHFGKEAVGVNPDRQGRKSGHTQQSTHVPSLHHSLCVGDCLCGTAASMPSRWPRTGSPRAPHSLFNVVLEITPYYFIGVFLILSHSFLVLHWVDAPYFNQTLSCVQAFKLFPYFTNQIML